MLGDKSAERARKEANEKRGPAPDDASTTRPPFPRTYVIGQHESAGLDIKLVGVFILDDGRSQTGGGRCLAGGVDRPRYKLGDVSNNK